MNKVGKGRERSTVWWSNTEEFKKWLKTKPEEDYTMYRKTRETKRIFRTVKDESWNKYGEHITQHCTRSPRKFYKNVKSLSLRDEHYDPANNFKDKNKNPIFIEKAIKQRWERILQGIPQSYRINRKKHISA